MRAGNAHYRSRSDLPDVLPVFPLTGALLLPRGNLPLNLFEPRYLAMMDYALGHDRLIGMIQPDPKGDEVATGPKLCKTGCIGRITGYQETGDGRYMLNLTGVCRFTPKDELPLQSGFRRVAYDVHQSDLDLTDPDAVQKTLNDREALIETFRRYLAANEMETDWDAVERTDDETLVTALCMMSPYGPAEKQALLEADDLNTRAETLIALTEMALARNSDDGTSIQ